MDQQLPDPVNMSDEELISAVAHQPELFGFVMERYEAKLSRYMARLGIQTEEDQQDVLQDVFIKVYKNVHAFDTSMKFSSWIYRIAHNEAVSWYRKRSVRPEGHLSGEGETILSFTSSQEPSAEVLVDREINAGALSRGLEKLDEKYRTVLILRFFEYKEYDEISDILQISIGSVGTLIHRGKARLKALLEDEFEEFSN